MGRMRIPCMNINIRLFAGGRAMLTLPTLVNLYVKCGQKTPPLRTTYSSNTTFCLDVNQSCRDVEHDKYSCCHWIIRRRWSKCLCVLSDSCVKRLGCVVTQRFHDMSSFSVSFQTNTLDAMMASAEFNIRHVIKPAIY